MAIAPLTATSAQIGLDTFVVSLHGELDLHTASTFEHRLQEALDEGARRVVIDLVGVTFLDSVALGVLTRGAKRLRMVKGECVVVCDDPRVLRVFEITGLERIFAVERSMAEAVDWLVGA